jgi:hypothetical protein
MERLKQLAEQLRSRYMSTPLPPSLAPKIHEGRQFASEADANTIEPDPFSWDILTSGLGAAIPAPVRVFRAIRAAEVLNNGISPTGVTFGSLNPGYASQYGRGMSQKVMEADITTPNLFDYEDVDHVNKLLEIAKTKGPDRYKAVDRRLSRILRGDWNAIEDDSVLQTIKDAGFTGLSTYEGGTKNLAVFDPQHWDLKRIIDNYTGKLIKR